MPDVSLDIDASDAMKTLDVQRFFRAMRGATEAAMEEVRVIAAEYPSQRRLQVARYWTPKQRAFFFAALRSGEIEVPYRRGQSPGSKTLDNMWEKELLPGGISGQVVNRVPYAKYVHGDKEQSKYHKGNWPTETDIARRATPAVRAAYQQAVNKL